MRQALSAHRCGRLCNSVRTVHRLLQGPSPGAVQTAWISYDGSVNRLQVYISNNGTKPSAPQLMAAVNVSQILGNNSAYVGFTGGSRCCK